MLKGKFTQNYILRYPIIGSKKPSMISILTEIESKLTTGGSTDTAVNFLDSLRASIDSE